MDSYIGTIMPWISEKVPEGWLVCNGEHIPISEYYLLHALIGYRYGKAEPNMFALPDLRGRTVVGAGKQSPNSNTYTLGQKGGEEKVSLAVQELPRHNHMLLANANTSSVSDASPACNVLGSPDGNRNIYVASGTTTHMHGSSIETKGQGEGHENMGPFITVNYIICYNGIYPIRE